MSLIYSPLPSLPLHQGNNETSVISSSKDFPTEPDSQETEEQRKAMQNMCLIVQSAAVSLLGSSG